MYISKETERLGFIQRNKKKLRVGDYIHYQDTIHSDGDYKNIGQQIILPSKYTEGLRYMLQ